MGIYITIASIIFAGSFTKQAKYFYKVGLVSLFLLTALRNPNLGGTDSVIYRYFFDAVPAINNLSIACFDYYGVGYVLLNSIAKTISSNYMVYQTIYALISIVLLNAAIKRLQFRQQEKCLFLFSYFCFRFIWNTWVTLRQNIANLIFWICLVLLFSLYDKTKEKQLTPKESSKTKVRIVEICIFAVIIPSLFHSSALVNAILLPLVGLFYLIPVKTKAVAVPVASVFLFVFGEPIYNSFLSLMASKIDNRYQWYIGITASGSNSINFCLRLAMFCFFAWRYEELQYRFKETTLNTLSIMVLIGSVNAELMTRMYEYYAIGLYIAMALLLRSFESKSKAIVAILYGVGMILILCRFIFITDGGLYLHYTLGI